MLTSQNGLRFLLCTDIAVTAGGKRERNCSGRRFELDKGTKINNEEIQEETGGVKLIQPACLKYVLILCKSHI